MIPIDDRFIAYTSVAVRHEGNHTVVAPRGRIFTDTIAPLQDALMTLLDVDHPRIILDMSAVELCDSSGLNLIAGGHNTAAGKGGWLRVAGLQPFVRRVIDITNLDKLLSIHATVHDAARADGAIPPGPPSGAT